MKTTIKIPAGYRRLKVGEIVRHGDKTSPVVGTRWLPCVESVGLKAFESLYVTFIRRIAPARKARKEGGKR